MPSVVKQGADPPAKRTRRSIVRGWLGQEAFWRDVTTRALATAIVGLGAYLYALGAGYIRTPNERFNEPAALRSRTRKGS